MGPEKNSGWANINAMEGCGADAAVFQFTRWRENGGPEMHYYFSERDEGLPDNTYQVLIDALNPPELHRLKFQEKLKPIDLHDTVLHRRLKASPLGNPSVDIFCKVEVITTGGVNRFGASFILHEVIKAVKECASDLLFKWEAFCEEERFCVGMFTAEKSRLRTLDMCNDTTASIYFLVRNTETTVLEDLMERLADVKGVQEVRCSVQSEQQSEPQGVVVWRG
ncbi:hypothetical protein KC318_g11771 [Hortaea werneckii]|nr:hypothetical protein KC334_g9993 [Hortaea werneckii]KAI7002952.1 hypothetical protein KC355_g9487 [Hortaea werneckii]KAI7165738.1 hypothetical protein KC324_g12394 [Hortaea werneckii]KAI7569911.1 hypothetical protein KC316_g12203 [Hortaea werneckii]KAI7657498.1 hypothetical protein KC318_g11771 [Hortaea werneckii]